MAKRVPGGIFLSKYLNFLPVLGVTLLLIVGIAAYQAVTRADEHDVLQAISITPNTAEELTIPPGGRVRLTAIGQYATMEMPTPANWWIELGENLGSLVGDCTGKTRCTVEAGEEEGEMTVRAAPVEIQGPGVTVHIYIDRAIQNPFTDAVPEWALDAVVTLNTLDPPIIRGYDDGRFGAADPVTRGQVITLLYRTLRHASFVDEPQDCTQEYSDVPPDHYAFTPACLFRARGWSPIEATLDPDSAAPREITATFVNSVFGPTLLEAQGVSEEDLTQGQVFTDIPVDDPFYTATRNLNSLEVMTGFPNGEFGKGETLNRAQVAVVIYRLLQQIDDYHIAALVHEAGGDGGGADEGELTNCELEEIDLNSDPDHCGQCNNACAAGETCVNGQCAEQEAVEGVDLIVTDITLRQEHPRAGDTLQFEYMLTNLGTADAPVGQARTKTTIDNFADGSVDITYQPLAHLLPAGQTFNGAAILDDIPAGTHLVRICADGVGPVNGFIEESNEDNNCLEETFVVEELLADLSVSGIYTTPENPVFGNTPFTVTFVEINSGEIDAAGPVPRYYFDRGNDGTWDFNIPHNAMEAPDVIADGFVSVSSGFLTQHPPQNSSKNLPVGTHKVKVCANDFNPPIEESDTSNNCGEAVFTVVGGTALSQNGTACTSNSQCTSGFCVDGVCCNIACAGTCVTCNLSAGSAGTCTNLPAGQDPANECPGLCNGAAGCGGPTPNGFACQTNAQCASGNCIDGFCCNTTCTGLCVRCNTPGSFGTCTNVADGIDPVNECPGSQVCNGQRACRAP